MIRPPPPSPGNSLPREGVCWFLGGLLPSGWVSNLEIGYPPGLAGSPISKGGYPPGLGGTPPPDWRGRRFQKGGTPPDRGVHPWFGEVVTFSMAMKVARKFWSRSAARADTFVKLQHFSVRRKVL